MVNKKIDAKKTKAETEMNQAEYANHRGVSRAAVTKWKKKGLIVLTKTEKIDVNRTDENIDNLVNTSSSKSVNNSSSKKVNKNCASKRKNESASNDRGSQESEFNTAKDIEIKSETLDGLRRILRSAGLLTKYEAEQVKENYLAYIRKLEAEEKAGKLVEAEPVQKQVYEIFRRERDALLNLPNRISAVLSAELGIDQNQLTILLEREINAFLRERTDQPFLRFG